MVKKGTILTMPNCGACENLTKNGMCKENDCISIGTKKGRKIAEEAKAEYFPQKVSMKNGKWQKENTDSVFKKFS